MSVTSNYFDHGVEVISVMLFHFVSHNARPSILVSVLQRNRTLGCKRVEAVRVCLCILGTQRGKEGTRERERRERGRTLSLVTPRNFNSTHHPLKLLRELLSTCGTSKMPLVGCHRGVISATAHVTILYIQRTESQDSSLKDY